VDLEERDQREKQRAIDHRGGHLQLIACAGSGKTETVSRRVASLVADGVEPASIVAFTFTERAAEELKSRIYGKVEESKGKDFLGRLGPLFVGTIHSYCFRMLQDNDPKYGNYDVLDEHRHAGLLARTYKELGLDGVFERKFKGIEEFKRIADVIGNELIDPAKLSRSEIGGCYQSYLDMLDRFRVLTFQMIIARAVASLKDSKIFKRVHDPLRHLIVDEYQDINPAQEELIKLLSKPPVQLCVVGDDDQSIYEWRGSNVENIVTFARRYSGAKQFRLLYNRRSRPTIIRCANKFAREGIAHRLDKKMEPSRPAGSHEVVTWVAETPEKEAERVGRAIADLHKKGFRYGEIAVLFRSVRTSAGPLVDTLRQMGIPFDCGGRTGLFMRPEIGLFARIYAWICDCEWQDGMYGEYEAVDPDEIAKGLNGLFAGPTGRVRSLKAYLKQWKEEALAAEKSINLVGDFYGLLNFLRAHTLDPDNPEERPRLGALARFSQLLADYEHVTRRSRWVYEEGRRVFRGGQDRGSYYYFGLYLYLQYYARDAYEDFSGEESFDADAVNILTVHQAKGLEWPVVFIPCLSSRRFPSSKTGRAQEWRLPKKVFPDEVRRRYEGDDQQERRLFYVAVTRARDAVYLSTFERIKNHCEPSPYLEEIAASNGGLQKLSRLPVPGLPDDPKNAVPPVLEIGFSDVAHYEECGYRYCLSETYGFQQELAPEMGYGKAIHHILRHIAEKTRETGKVPTKSQARQIMENEFYLPFANRPGFEEMKTRAGYVVERYLNAYASDLERVWAIEMPFELQVDGGIVDGKADVILDMVDGRPGRLAIVDYKSAKALSAEERFHFQIQVYTAAGRGEGLEVASGYLHDLTDGHRDDVDVGDEAAKAAVARLGRSVQDIRRGHFPPCGEKETCRRCDYKVICRHSKSTL
jgi:DNA helicase-2/ATP-dependent DNA helicase PcrA